MKNTDIGNIIEHNKCQPLINKCFSAFEHQINSFKASWLALSRVFALSDKFREFKI